MTTLYQIDSDVLFKRLDDRMVLVHLSSNRIFELNETGARIWELLQKGVATEDLLAQIPKEFEADHESLNEEIKNLLNDLETENLIKRLR